VTSQHRTPQLTLPWKWLTIHDYEMSQFWHSASGSMQHSRRFPMLSKLAASVPVEAVFSTTGLILNGNRSVLASSIEFRSFVTIMQFRIDRKQWTWMIYDFFSVTLLLISSMRTWLFDIDINMSSMQCIIFAVLCEV